MDNAKNTAQIKQSNIGLIRDSLFTGRSLTKKQISEITGLSLATCTALLSELIDLEQVIELEFAAPKGGRPARRFSINPDFAHVLCLYTDNNSPVPGIKIRVNDLKGNVLDEYFIPTPGGVAAGGIRSAISDALSMYHRVKIIGLGISGIADDDDVVETSEFKELIGIQLKTILENEFGIEVFVGNDMYFTSYGFYLMSKRKKPFSLSVSLWPENRLSGAGSVVDGHILLGSSRFAGEISNLPYRVSKDMLRSMTGNKSQLTLLVGTYLTSAISLLDPDVIYLTGRSVNLLSKNDLIKWCLQYIPENHLPDIIIQPDIYEEYMKGIFEITRSKIHF